MSRNACNGENGETGEKSPAAGDLNWMPNGKNRHACNGEGNAYQMKLC